METKQTNQSAGEVPCIETWAMMLIEAYKMILSI